MALDRDELIKLIEEAAGRADGQRIPLNLRYLARHMGTSNGDSYASIRLENLTLEVVS